MTKTQKIVLSIPSILILFIIPYNFFADLEGENYNMIFNGILVLQILYLIGLIYILLKLWKDDKKTKNKKHKMDLDTTNDFLYATDYNSGLSLGD